MKLKLPTPFCDEPRFFAVFTLFWFGCYISIPIAVLVSQGILNALYIAIGVIGFGSLQWFGGCIAAYMFCKSDEVGNPKLFRPEGRVEILSRLLPAAIRASMFEPAYNDEKAEFLLKVAKTMDLNERLALIQRFRWRVVLMMGQCIYEAVVDSARSIGQLLLR